MKRYKSATKRTEEKAGYFLIAISIIGFIVLAYSMGV